MVTNTFSRILDPEHLQNLHDSPVHEGYGIWNVIHGCRCWEELLCLLFYNWEITCSVHKAEERMGFKGRAL